MTRTFWSLHGLAWLAYGVSTYLTFLPNLAPGQYGPMLAVKTVRTAIGCALSALLYAGFQRLRRANPPLPILLVCVIASSAALGVAWLWLYWLITGPVRDGQLPAADWTRFPRAAMDYAFVLMTWSLAAIGVQEWAARRDAQHRATAAELAAREAELRMLRYQLNPHFLFNALNSVRAMMPLDATAARDSVDALAGFLRYTLQASLLPFLRLEQEVEAARHYLAVEQLRFGDRLRVTIDLDPRVAQVQVPGFLLHPLVENAVKHGMASGARPLHIGIHAVASKGHIRIEVTNTVGPVMTVRRDPFATGDAGNGDAGNRNTGSGDARPGAAAIDTRGEPDTLVGGANAGVGLENVRRRVPLYFQDRARFAIAREDDVVRATILLDRARVH